MGEMFYLFIWSRSQYIENETVISIIFLQLSFSFLTFLPLDLSKTEDLIQVFPYYCASVNSFRNSRFVSVTYFDVVVSKMLMLIIQIDVPSDKIQ